MIRVTYHDFPMACFAYQAHVTHVLGDVYGEWRLTPDERIVRFVEESIELAQAHGLTRERIVAVVDYVLARPADRVEPEIGGVFNTLLAYATSRGVDAGVWAMETLRTVETRAEFYRAKDQTKHR